MKNMLQKSFLTLGLIATYGLAADWTPPFGACPMPADYEQPVVQQDETTEEQQSTLKKTCILAASLIANALAVGVIATTNGYVEGKLWEVGGFSTPMLCLGEIGAVVSTMGMVELSSYLMNKIGLKTNKLCLGLVGNNPLLKMLAYSSLSRK